MGGRGRSPHARPAVRRPASLCRPTALLLAGAGMWQAPAGRRLAATLAVYFVLFLIVGRPDNFYWGLLIVPVLPLGALGWTKA